MIISYIIYPILGLLVIGLGFLIAKKNNLTSNKKLIIYLVVCILLLTIPALFGLLDYNFMPYGYLTLGLLYLIMGYYNTKIITWLFKEKPTYLIELSLFIFTLLSGMLLFSLLFNFCNELQYGLWASTSVILYLFPSLYRKTNQLFLDIPIEVYNVWAFNKSPVLTNNHTIDYNKLKVVRMELFKQEGDIKPTTINAKAPYDTTFGEWFKRLLTDYNTKSPLSPIEPNSNSKDSGWIFYVKPSIFLPRNYIDFNKTFKENRISEKYTIVAKRVKETIEKEKLT